jgi:hypothetical protein
VQPGSEQGLLNHILGQLTISGGPQGEGEERRPVLGYEGSQPPVVG